MFFRIAKYSIKNILRNKFLSFSSVLVLTLLMFFINTLIILHDVSLKLISSINSKLTISLYLDEEYDKTSTEVIWLIEDIKEIKWNIQVEYKTKEVILEEIRLKEPDLAKILERTNPLPDTIILSQIELEEYELVNESIEKKLRILSKDESDTEHFSNYTTQYKKINQLIHVLDILRIGLYIIIITFLLSIFIITYSIIGNFIYYYKDEIYITRLVWWSKMFIYGPFVLQWSFYSFVSFLSSLIVFLFILKNINGVFSEIYYFDLSYNIFLIEMLVFIFVWGLSGFISSRKYLK